MSLGFIWYQSCHAADTSKVEVRGSVDDGTSEVQDTGLIVKLFATGARQQQFVSLAADSFTNVTVPTDAKAVLIDVMTSDGIKLKGVSADTGISLDSTCPVLLPLSRDGTVTIGFLNMEDEKHPIRLYWF